MKICMLIDVYLPYLGGGQVHTKELIKHLKRNHSCQIDLYTQSSINLFSRLFWCFKVIPQVFIAHQKKKYHLIHAHAYLAAFPAKIISLLTNTPLVFTVHGVGIDAWQKRKKKMFSAILQKAEEFILLRIKYNHQITVSRNFLKYSNVNKNISVISNGVDIKKFDQIKGIKKNKNKILFVGRIHWEKGIEYLLTAMPEIIKVFPNVKLHIIGSGNKCQISGVKSQISKLKIQNNVNLRGELSSENLIKEYKSSRLFILPSLYEGQPLTLLEAWAAELPVVVTNVGANPDFVKHGINGYLVKSGDSNLLAKTMIKALKNPKLFLMGQKGYQLVKEKYTWQKTAQKTYQVYQKCLKTKP